jgi:hypothetical protein
LGQSEEAERWPPVVAKKMNHLKVSSDSALQDNSSNEDVFDSHSDDEEIVSMKLLYHVCLSEICSCKI